MIPNIFGGIFLNNILAGADDKYTKFQIDLVNEGLLQGIQVVVPNSTQIPVMTDKSDAQIEEIIKEAIGVLPAETKFFVHLGAESAGVDQGERFDEFGEFAKKRPSADYPWEKWNKETLDFGLKVARLISTPYDGVIATMHPGYGWNPYDLDAKNRVVAMAKHMGPEVALENVPPNVQEHYWKHYRHLLDIAWSRPSFWGFGGTPDEMRELLHSSGTTEQRCLIDFTHVIVAAKQARCTLGTELYPEMGFFNTYPGLDEVVDGYTELPHVKICHYSGNPHFPADSHDFCHIPPPEEVLSKMAKMEAICLELRWNPNESDRYRYLLKTFLKHLNG